MIENIDLNLINHREAYCQWKLSCPASSGNNVILVVPGNLIFLLIALFHSVFNLSVWGVSGAQVWLPYQKTHYACKTWALSFIGRFALNLYTLAMNYPILPFTTLTSFYNLESMLSDCFAKVSPDILAPLRTLYLSYFWVIQRAFDHQNTHKLFLCFDWHVIFSRKFLTCSPITVDHKRHDLTFAHRQRNHIGHNWYTLYFIP